jgi:hypothetical protein
MPLGSAGLLAKGAKGPKRANADGLEDNLRL